MNKKNNISLNQLLTTYAIFIILPIVIIGLGSYTIFTHYIYEQINVKNKIIGSNLSDRIEQIINISGDEITTISQIIAKSDDDIISYSFERMFNGLKFYENLFYYDEDCRLKVSYPEKKHFYNFDFSYKPVLKKVRLTKEPTWSSVYISEFNNHPAISFTAPSIVDGKVQGFVSGVIKLQKLIDTLNFVNTENHHIAMVITDNKDTILVHPDKNKMEQLQKLTIDNLKDNTIIIDKIKYIVTYNKIKSNGWNIYLLQNFDSISSPLIIFKIVLLVVLIFGFITTVIYLYISYSKIFIPLKMITNYTTRVARGKYDLPELKLNIKEILTLYENFKKMIERVNVRERSLIDNQKKFRDLVEENIDSIFKINSSLTITYISPSIEKLLGYSPEEFARIINTLSGMNPIIPDKRLNIKALRAIRDTFTKQIVPDPFVIKVLHKNETCLFLEIQINPLKNKNNLIYEIQATARDITRRYNAERKADYFRNYFFSIIDSMPSSIITFNENGEIDQFNNSALKLLNTNNQLVKGKKLWDVNEHYSEYQKYFDVVTNTNMPLDFNDKMEFQTGTNYFKVTIFPLKNNRNLLAMRVDDITKLTITEKQLRQAQKLKSIGNMAESLAHDLNNVLGALAGAVNLIEYKVNNDMSDTLAEDIDIMKEATEKGKNVIKQLSVISKPLKSKHDICDLNLMLDKLTKTFEKEHKNIFKIFYIPYKNTALTMGNVERLEEMFLNVIKNATESISENGSISISLKLIVDDEVTDLNKDKENYWQVSIKDKGYIISEDDIENIFDPFYKNNSTGKKHGINLTMAFNTARNHNGFIDCFSDKENGTTFTIYLPNFTGKEESVNTMTEVKEKKIMKGHGTILIVDDENVIRYTSRRMLELCGYSIIEAKNGLEAIALYKDRNKDIECVLLDFFMPDMNGLEVYNEICKINKKIPVVLSSGLRNYNKINEALSSGINQFVLKPYTIEELSSSIYTAINKKD